MIATVDDPRAIREILDALALSPTSVERAPPPGTPTKRVPAVAVSA